MCWWKSDKPFLEQRKKEKSQKDETGLEHASASTRQNQQTLGILGKVAARLESEDTWRKGKKEKRYRSRHSPRIERPLLHGPRAPLTAFLIVWTVRLSNLESLITVKKRKGRALGGLAPAPDCFARMGNAASARPDASAPPAGAGSVAPRATELSPRGAPSMADAIARVRQEPMRRHLIVDDAQINCEVLQAYLKRAEVALAESHGSVRCPSWEAVRSSS